VACSNGQEIGSKVVDYPNGKHGVLIDSRDPNVARQLPGDCFIGLEKSVKAPQQNPTLEFYVPPTRHLLTAR
jgi:L-ribulokinase